MASIITTAVRRLGYGRYSKIAYERVGFGRYTVTVDGDMIGVWDAHGRTFVD